MPMFRKVNFDKFRRILYLQKITDFLKFNTNDKLICKFNDSHPTIAAYVAYR